MGLLDTFNNWQQDTDMESPNNQRMMAMAAALLQAGGPSLKPTSLGQALGGAMQYGQQAYQGAEDRSLLKQARSQEMKMKKLQEQRAQTEFENEQAWLKKITGGGQQMQPQASGQQPMKLNFDPSGNGEFMSQPNLPQPAQPSGGQNQFLGGMGINDLAEGAARGRKGMKEVIELYKYANDPMKMESGSTYVNRLDGKERYMPKMGEGARINSQGQYENIPGYEKAIAGTEGAKSAATEAAKAQYDFMPLSINQPVTLPNGQTLQPGTYNLSKAQIADVNMAQQGQLTAPQPMQQQQPMQGQSPMQGLPQPGNSTQAELNARSTQLRANQPQMDNDRLTILQQELANERDPNNRMMLQREIARVGGGQAPQPAQQQFAPQAQNQPRFGIPLQSEAEKQAAIEAAKKSVGLQYDPLIEQQTGSIKGKQGTKNTLNDNWIKQSYNPTLEAGSRARDVAASLDTLANVDFKTGWGADAKVAAANALVGLGLAPKNAEFYAANGQVFKSEIMKQLVQTFEGQKGTQTEGDAKRVQQTFAEISNTPLANQFIADLARAKANRDAKKAAFYTKALPLAEAEGDLNQVDRRWMKLQTSIWDDPVLQKYKREAK